MSTAAPPKMLSPALRSWQAAFDAQPNVDDGKRQAFADFLARGLPTASNDAWKYTDLRWLTMRAYRASAPSLSSKHEVTALLLPLEACHRLVFVDGEFDRTLSTPLPAAVSIRNSEDRARDPEVFELLNAALNTSALRLDVSANAQIDAPIYIAHIWTRNATALMSHPRVTLALHADARATLIEHHIARGGESNFINAVMDIDLGNGASLEHIRLQDDARGNFNIGSTRVAVAKAGSYLNHHYVFGASLARLDLRVNLNGEQARTELHGLVVANQTQHLDVHTCIAHQAPDTQSREDYRGIADHRGRVVFNGKVIVAKDAQRTDAAQSSRNLLLSPHAEIDTRPELEIYANDVKCAHGATVGQLDAASLFYLRSRGLSQDEAHALLTQAFAIEVIDRVPVAAVRDYVLAGLVSRMQTEGQQP